MRIAATLGLTGLALAGAWGPISTSATPNRRATSLHAVPPAVEPATLSEVVETYCTRCHNERRLRGNLSLEGFDPDTPEADPEVAERMITKLRAGMMPPRSARRPGGDTLQALAAAMEERIDAAHTARPGTRPFQRLNRAEYEALIESVLGLRVDAGEWLPTDQISASFDNIADAQTLSPTLMDAYLTAASEIARRAVGQPDAPVAQKTWTNPPSVSQHEWDRVEGAPFGTRGGISALHAFPADGEYVFSMSFMSGWGERDHDIDISIDGERIALVKYGGDIDFQGRKSFPIETGPLFIRAGEHRVTAAFVRTMDGPYEDLIRPHDWSLTGTEASYGTTSLPHLMSLTVEGPHNPVGVSETATRTRIFRCRPTAPEEEEPCAESILSSLATRAYGRPAGPDEVRPLMVFFREGRRGGDFELGIRTALEALLASPHFLFRMEREPAEVPPGAVFPLEGSDLAKRLSFFLWGTNPDDELQQAAASGRLADPAVLEAQARRMLADSRADALADRFAALWLRLQDLESVEPDAFWFPDYNHQVMEAMSRETRLFFSHLVRENRSFLDLFRADYSFMNERLANHYGIPGVVGDHFRQVSYPDDHRRGILGHGSVLVQTSLGNRTSPVLRGKWVMEVLLGSPPPPPPPGVPDLDETEGVTEGRTLTTGERMAVHRQNPACSSCHNVIDPIGLALDQFDVTGRWRIRENGVGLDTRGTFYDGTEIASAADLSAALLARPIPLVRHFTSSLMAYALGRRVEYGDQPTIRQIVNQAADEDYAVSSLILGVVLSDPFRMKEAS